jgi:hypothetical protein
MPTSTKYIPSAYRRHFLFPLFLIFHIHACSYENLIKSSWSRHSFSGLSFGHFRFPFSSGPRSPGPCFRFPVSGLLRSSVSGTLFPVSGLLRSSVSGTLFPVSGFRSPPVLGLRDPVSDVVASDATAFRSLIYQL